MQSLHCTLGVVNDVTGTDDSFDGASIDRVTEARASSELH